MGSSLLWNVMSIYMSFFVRVLVIKNEKKMEDVVSKYFGIFFFFLLIFVCCWKFDFFNCFVFWFWKLGIN